jgi:hypothetical protein
LARREAEGRPPTSVWVWRLRPCSQRWARKIRLTSKEMWIYRYSAMVKKWNSMLLYNRDVQFNEDGEQTSFNARSESYKLIIDSYVKWHWNCSWNCTWQPDNEVQDEPVRQSMRQRKQLNYRAFISGATKEAYAHKKFKPCPQFVKLMPKRTALSAKIIHYWTYAHRKSMAWNRFAQSVYILLLVHVHTQPQSQSQTTLMVQKLNWRHYLQLRQVVQCFRHVQSVRG